MRTKDQTIHDLEIALQKSNVVRDIALSFIQVLNKEGEFKQHIDLVAPVDVYFKTLNEAKTKLGRITLSEYAEKVLDDINKATEIYVRQQVVNHAYNN